MERFTVDTLRFINCCSTNLILKFDDTLTELLFSHNKLIFQVYFEGKDIHILDEDNKKLYYFIDANEFDVILAIIKATGMKD